MPTPEEDQEIPLPSKLKRSEGFSMDALRDGGSLGSFYEFNVQSPLDELPPVKEYIDFSLPPRRLWIGTGSREAASKERTFKSLNSNRELRSIHIPKRTLNGFLCMDGTIQVTKTSVVATRALYSGQFIAYMMPGGSHSIMTHTTRIDHGHSKTLFNVSKESCLTVRDVDDYHFSTRLRFTSSILIANCCLCDDTRIVLLENIYVNPHNGEQISSSNTVELICYLGNWSTSGQ